MHLTDTRTVSLTLPTFRRAGPPNCKYLDFDNDNQCWLSKVCAGHEDPEANLIADGLDNLGVMQGT
jgi:hypothetical protein